MSEDHSRPPRDSGLYILGWVAICVVAAAVWSGAWVAEWRYARGPFGLVPAMAWVLPALMDLLPVEMAYAYLHRQASGPLATGLTALVTVMAVLTMQDQHASGEAVIAVACFGVLVLGFAAMLRNERDRAAMPGQRDSA